MSAPESSRVRLGVGPGVEPLMDPERLDVYGVALEFQLVTAAAVPRGHRTL